MVTERDNWDRHWNEYGDISDYNPGVSYRKRIIRRLLKIEPDRQGYKLLELGSGTGQFAREFCPHFPLVKFLGLDISEQGVQKARLHALSARFEVCDLLQSVPTGEIRSFGATHALCSEVLEHVDEPERLLRNAGSLMARDCRIVITVPGGPMTDFDKHIGHRKHFSPSDLKSLISAAGFEIEKVGGLGFPFYNLYRLALLSRGSGLVGMVSGPPSLLIRTGYHVFDRLCRLNLDRWCWQTVGIARWPGR
jgi:SAM-dependent methyltransferase